MSFFPETGFSATSTRGGRHTLSSAFARPATSVSVGVGNRRLHHDLLSVSQRDQVDRALYRGAVDPGHRVWRRQSRSVVTRKKARPENWLQQKQLHPIRHTESVSGKMQLESEV